LRVERVFLKFNLRNPLAEKSPALADEEGIVLWGQSRHQLSTAVGLDYWERSFVSAVLARVAAPKMDEVDEA